MEDKKIKIIINNGMPSFIHDASISSYLYQFFEEYQNSFPHTFVIVHLIEDITPSSTSIKPRLLGKTKDRKLQINIAFSRFQNGGRLTAPSSVEFYRQLKFVMDKEVENYTSNIDEINPVLTERLKQIGIDINTEKNPYGNHLKASLAIATYSLNFEKRINELSDDDLYQLGSSIIVADNKGVIYTKPQIISMMKDRLENV